jgi:hypothetical protein
MIKKCQICEKIIGKRDKELIALCKDKKIFVCSMTCYNDWEDKNCFLEEK